MNKSDKLLSIEFLSIINKNQENITDLIIRFKGNKTHTHTHRTSINQFFSFATSDINFSFLYAF